MLALEARRPVGGVRLVKVRYLLLFSPEDGFLYLRHVHHLNIPALIE